MEKKEWFASWFDTSYYHTLYKKRDDDEAKLFITNLVQILNLDAGSKVLDLACGKGRHSVTLNELGFDVLGVDLSPNSILEANKNSNTGLHFDVHDMRKIIPNVSFKAIFNLFTSFGYFDELSDNTKMVESVFKMLETNGLFIIDFMNVQKVISKLVEKEEKIIDGIHFKIERRYNGTHIFKEIRFNDNGEDFHFTERVQALKRDDFDSLLTSNGFEILTTFGNLDLNSFDEETSDRLIIIAKKVNER